MVSGFGGLVATIILEPRLEVISNLNRLQQQKLKRQVKLQVTEKKKMMQKLRCRQEWATTMVAAVCAIVVLILNRSLQNFGRVVHVHGGKQARQLQRTSKLRPCWAMSEQPRPAALMC